MKHFKSVSEIKIILVLPEEHLELGREIVDGFLTHSQFISRKMGKQGFILVANGLALIEEESIIFVHDGVRCLLTPQLIQRCYDHGAGNR